MPLDQQNSEEEKEMSFVDHLEELRWHIVRSVAAVAVGFTVAFVFAKWIFDNIVFAPARANFITFRALANSASIGKLTLYVLPIFLLKFRADMLPVNSACSSLRRL